jgi:hypothetical protein
MKKTLKIFAFGLILTLAVPLASLNAQLFDKGDIVVSAGVGLGSNYNAFGSTYSNIMPVIFLTGDYCLREDLGPGNLGVGAIIGFSSYKENYYTDEYLKVKTFLLGARGTYHFTDLVDKLDLYGGITMGGEIVSSKYTGDGVYNDAGSGFLGEFFAGARYYFTDDFSVMGELGYGISWLKLGISYKF